MADGYPIKDFTDLTEGQGVLVRWVAKDAMTLGGDREVWKNGWVETVLGGKYSKKVAGVVVRMASGGVLTVTEKTHVRTGEPPA